MCRDAGSFPNDAEQEMLGADVVVPQAPRLLAGVAHYLARAVSEAVEHVYDPTSPA